MSQLANQDSSSPPKTSNHISWQARCAWLFGVWLVAWLATAPTLEALWITWLFPLGLLAWLAPPAELETLFIGLIWLGYGVLNSSLLLLKQRRHFFYVWYGLLALLTVNVSGCHYLFASV